MFASWNPSQPEITDLIIAHDPVTYLRQPVRKSEVQEIFTGLGNRQALAAIRDLPECNGILDPRAIDQLLLTIHWEMQRLGEEFYHGHRVRDLLLPVIATLRSNGLTGPLRIVDVGTGIGYVIRWLAARTSLPSQEIQLVGMDLNSTLVREATRLATAENLPCQFIQGDAFSREFAAHIYLSTGVIHHFRDAALPEFLRRHDLPETHAFLHFDFHPWTLAPVGSWFFHVLRMRTAVSRHDGVLSAARAHTAATLTGATRTVLPAFSSGIYGGDIWGTSIPRVFQTLLGIRRELLPALRKNLGRRVGRLGPMS